MAPLSVKRQQAGAVQSGTKRQQAGAVQSFRSPKALQMTDWPHSPVHRVYEAGTYMVTAGTYLKQPLFRGADRLRYLCEKLLELAETYQWQLQAWAVFPNHYHFVGLSPEPISEERQQAGAVQKRQRTDGGQKRQQAAALQTLAEFTKHLHSLTAIEVNRWDQAGGRQAWFQYWDTRLTFQKSYLARLSYVHKNAVHHGLVREPSLYPWCSAGWFQRRATAAFYKTVMGMKVDRVRVADEFAVDVSEV